MVGEADTVGVVVGVGVAVGAGAGDFGASASDGPTGARAGRSAGILGCMALMGTDHMGTRGRRTDTPVTTTTGPTTRRPIVQMRRITTTRRETT